MARAKSQILSKEDLKTAKAEAKAALKEAQAAAKAAEMNGFEIIMISSGDLATID